MATIINNRFFKTPQGKKRYLLAPLFYAGALKGVIYLINNYSIVKK